MYIPIRQLNLWLFILVDRSCKTDMGWRQFNTYMDTGIGHADDAETGLIFRVPGFKDDRATIVLEYETHCTSLCTFILESVSDRQYFIRNFNHQSINYSKNQSFVLLIIYFVP